MLDADAVVAPLEESATLLPVAVDTVGDSPLLVEAPLVASPEYWATIECVPAASAFVVHVATRVLSDPERGDVAHPGIVVPPAVTPTVPVGEEPVTLAEKSTLAAGRGRDRSYVAASLSSPAPTRWPRPRFRSASCSSAAELVTLMRIRRSCTQ